MADSSSEKVGPLIEMLAQRLAEVLYPSGGKRSEVATADSMLDTLDFDRPNKFPEKSADWFMSVLGPILSSDYSDEQKVSSLKRLLEFDPKRNPVQGEPAYKKYGSNFDRQFGPVEGKVGTYGGRDVYMFRPNASTGATGGFTVPGHNEMYINKDLGVRQRKVAHEGTHLDQYYRSFPGNMQVLQREKEDQGKVDYFNRAIEQMAREAEGEFPEIKPEFRYMYEQMKKGPGFKDDLLEMTFPTQAKEFDEGELVQKREAIRNSVMMAYQRGMR